jgi:uncharacterized protein (TIGR00251 family)
MSCRLKLRIVPNAKRSELAGTHGDAIKLKIAAPAIEGRANEALVEFLAEKLGVPQRNIALVSGAKSRDKLVEIDGMSEADARALLASG